MKTQSIHKWSQRASRNRTSAVPNPMKSSALERSPLRSSAELFIGFGTAEVRFLEALWLHLCIDCVFIRNLGVVTILHRTLPWMECRVLGPQESYRLNPICRAMLANFGSK